MFRFEWFAEDEVDDLSDAQRVLLAGLRARAGTWPCGPERTQLVEPDDRCPQWRAILDIGAELESKTLISVGLCFDGTGIWGGELEPQSYYPHWYERSRVEFLQAGGTPEELAQLAADWFEQILARPVERREWLSNGSTAYQYAFSDNGCILSYGGGWNTFGAFDRLPDRVIHARGIPADAVGRGTASNPA